MLKYEGGFRVLSQQSESADNRPDIAGQNGAIVDQAARLFSAGERYGAETPATGDKATSGERKHWLDYATAFLTLAAAGGAITAAVFTGWQATTADQGLRDSNRAYVHSTNFRFVHYGAKNESGRTQWSISPLIENTGTTGTRGMLMNSIITSAGEPDFDSLENAAFSPALILPKSEMTGAVFSMDGRGLDLLRPDRHGDHQIRRHFRRPPPRGVLPPRAIWPDRLGRRPRRSAAAHSRHRLRGAQLRRQRVRSGLARACHCGRKQAARDKQYAP
jgi:hypothetical protein